MKEDGLHEYTYIHTCTNIHTLRHKHKEAIHTQGAEEGDRKEWPAFTILRADTLCQEFEIYKLIVRVQ